MSLSKVSEKYTEEAFKKYPHYKTYVECQSRVFSLGMGTFVSTAALVYVGQELVKKWLPMTPQMRIGAPVLISTAITYFVTMKRTKVCQNMWMALEDKHTAITPASESPPES